MEVLKAGNRVGELQTSAATVGHTGSDATVLIVQLVERGRVIRSYPSRKML